MSGAWMSIAVGLAAMLVALALGMLAALAKLSGHRLLRRLAAAYTVIIRGVPELVLMLLIYYGGTTLLQNLIALFGKAVRVDINAFAAGTLVLGFVYGAYATEIFRGAFLAVPRGQIEAGFAFGMTRRRVFWRIHLPQAWRFALPGLGNLWLTLLKATSITSVIGLTELARQAYLIMPVSRKPFVTFFLASLLYLAMTAVSDLLRMYFARRAAAGVRLAG
ncbi:MAG TPA: ABC transporter permease subunit [Dongiaceae bacterium]|nr:ABC transporter permease subunit [Dongiaceae bacterium]